MMVPRMQHVFVRVLLMCCVVNAVISPEELQQLLRERMFIHIRHTNRGDSKHALVSITEAHTVFIQIHRASYTCT